mmetsp:Transcript_77968/g.252932  ORF Transcript_77968/g.252932 Transcript_77968/m.252932 type:complete len:207 (+) Transcript_77968:1755-2375(+)
MFDPADVRRHLLSHHIWSNLVCPSDRSHLGVLEGLKSKHAESTIPDPIVGVAAFAAIVQRRHSTSSSHHGSRNVDVEIRHEVSPHLGDGTVGEWRICERARNSNEAAACEVALRRGGRLVGLGRVGFAEGDRILSRLECRQNFRVAPSQVLGIVLFASVPIDLFVQMPVVEGRDVMPQPREDRVARSDEFRRCATETFGLQGPAPG